MSNWIEKAAEEIEELVELKETIGAKAAAAIILSHAPVIDAEKLAETIKKVDWVDNKAEWGGFELKLFDFKNGDCQWEIFCKDRRVDTDVCDNQKLAQAACVDALKRIVTGSK